MSRKKCDSMGYILPSQSESKKSKGESDNEVKSFAFRRLGAPPVRRGMRAMRWPHRPEPPKRVANRRVRLDSATNQEECERLGVCHRRNAVFIEARETL